MQRGSRGPSGTGTLRGEVHNDRITLESNWQQLWCWRRTQHDPASPFLGLWPEIKFCTYARRRGGEFSEWHCFCKKNKKHKQPNQPKYRRLDESWSHKEQYRTERTWTRIIRANHMKLPFLYVRKSHMLAISYGSNTRIRTHCFLELDGHRYQHSESPQCHWTILFNMVKMVSKIKSLCKKDTILSKWINAMWYNLYNVKNTHSIPIYCS